MMRYLLTFIVAGQALIRPLDAATYYIDNNATGTANGTSWANAWTTLDAVTGLSSGDIVYISGGSSGNSKTYEVDINPSYPGQWLNVVDGVTYKIGQDAGHNGKAIFDGLGGTYWLVQNWNNVTISGDAGDGLCHFELQDTSYFANGSGWEGVLVEYVTASNAQGWSADSSTGFELRHCTFAITATDADHWLFLDANCTGWDKILIHHNTVTVPTTTGGIGADGLQANGEGLSFYSNTLTSVMGAYTGGQHADGWQTTGNTSKCKFYGNRIIGFLNYAIYVEPAFGGFEDVWVYNNVVQLATANTSQGIVVAGTVANPCTRVVVANNTVDGYHYAYTFRNPSASPSAASFVDCEFINNLGIDSGAGDIIDATITQADNVSRTAVQAATDFVNYTEGATDNDYTPVAGASALVDQGTDLSSYFTADLIGVTRPQGDGWDVGAYEYTSGSSAPTAPNTATLAAYRNLGGTISWTDASDNETGFKIERSTDNTNWTLLTTTAANATSYTDRTAFAGTTYYYRVRATNGAGDSADATPTPSSVTTAPPAPVYRGRSGNAGGGF